MRIGPDDSGSVVTVPRGHLLEIALPQNAGTGYEWQLDPLPPGLELLADHTDPAPSGAAGAAGRRLFTIKVDASGTVTARLRRAWEPPEAGPRTFTADVVAD